MKHAGPTWDKRTVDLFARQLLRADLLGAVIRGHAYVESNLIQLIESALPDPGALDLTRVNFPTKRELAVAMRLLSKGGKPGYAALNRLRNKFAHNIDAQFLESDEQRLYRALSKAQKDRADGFVKFFATKAPKLPFPLLRVSITALCIESLDQLMSVSSAHEK